MLSRRDRRPAALHGRSYSPRCATAELLEARRLLSADPRAVELVSDLAPGNRDADPTNIAGLDAGRIVYWSENMVYASDGTADGTVFLKGRFPFAPDTIEGSDNYPQMTGVNGLVFFLAHTTNQGNKFLWKTDGTPNGTVPVMELPTRYADEVDLAAAGDALYVGAPATGGPTGPSNLWRIPVAPGGAAGEPSLVRQFTYHYAPHDMTLFQGQVYFFSGREFYRTDGTPAGTVQVNDTGPSAALTGGWNLSAEGGLLYFQGETSAAGAEPWRSDGTAAGTFQLSDLVTGTASSGPDHFIGLPNGRVVFTYQDAAGTYLLRSTTGTTTAPVTTGTSLTLQYNSEPTRAGGFVYFKGTNFAGDGLWRTDGTSAGTIRLKPLAPSGFGGGSAYFLTAFGSSLYYSEPATGLWTSDGTPAGTVNVSPYAASPLAAAAGRLYLGARDAEHGLELWTSDGTGAGTRLVKDVNVQPYSSTFATDRAVTLNGVAYFDVGEASLYRSNGTPAGTSLVTDIDSIYDHGPEHLTTWGGALYFAAHSGSGTDTLWRSNGTPAGTVQLKTGLRFSAYAGATSTTTTPAPFFVPFRGELYFLANDALWKTDGTAAGTVGVAGYSVTGSGPTLSYANRLTAAGDRLYFAGGTNQELWVSDGTPAGTRPFRDIYPMPSGLPARDLTAIGGNLFWVIPALDDPTQLPTLWKTDGTAAGTVRLAPPVAPGGRVTPALPRGLAAFGNTLLFTADDGVHGMELWRSDGTPGGTAPLADLAPGPVGSDPQWITPAGDGRAYFTADGPAGRELWATDGTAAGTVQVADVNPAGDAFADARDGDLSPLAAAAGRVFFAADDGTHGVELWQTDGTGPGTALVADLYPGATGGAPRPIAIALRGGSPGGEPLLLFAGEDPTHGVELFAVHTNLAPVVDLGGPFTVAEGRPLSLSVAGSSDPDGTVVRYEWDFDYDGARFDVDAAGAAVSFAPPDGPSTRTVAVRVTDNLGASAIAAAPVAVTNVNPTAAFTNSGPVTVGAGATVSFSNAADVAADLSAGLRYGFDFDDDGTFEVTDSASPAAAVPASYLASAGTRTVRGRVADKDGGFTDYTTAITVLPAPTQLTLSAVADAYVRDGTSAGTNFGSATQLQVKLSGGVGSTREAYLRFDLSQVGNVTSAVLRLWGSLSAGGENVTVGAYPVADVGWGEGAINWNNKPAAGATPVATTTLLGTAAKWYEWDLTDYLKQQKAAGAGAATVVLRGAAISAANAAFDSDESATAANRPQLVVKSQAADVTAPALAGLSAGGGAWSAAFRGYLQSAGLGDGGGFALPLTAAAASSSVPPLPWTNVDRLSIRFSEAVDVRQGDLLIAGARGAGAYGIKGFSYDPATFTATWTLAAPLSKPDRLRLSIAAGAVADLAGNALPAASFQFDVLPGDATRDGRVTASDELDVRNRIGRSTAAPGTTGGPRGYSAWADLDGNGRIDAADYAAARARLATALPAAAPPPLFSAQRLSLAAANLVGRLREDRVLA